MNLLKAKRAIRVRICYLFLLLNMILPSWGIKTHKVKQPKQKNETIFMHRLFPGRLPRAWTGKSLVKSLLAPF